MMLGSLREGNRGTSLAFFLPWSLLMQILGYGFIMPIYTSVHLSTSPTAIPENKPKHPASAIRIRQNTPLTTLPTSIAIGYILPTILMALPFNSTVTKQWFGGLWQGFPVWIVVVQGLGGCGVNLFLDHNLNLNLNSKILILISTLISPPQSPLKFKSPPNSNSTTSLSSTTSTPSPSSSQQPLISSPSPSPSTTISSPSPSPSPSSPSSPSPSPSHLITPPSPPSHSLGSLSLGRLNRRIPHHTNPPPNPHQIPPLPPTRSIHRIERLAPLDTNLEYQFQRTKTGRSCVARNL
ncbi:hypothetical protein EAE96_008538 [Botrytis aclada]|nr:hypothetical protein EAE96_008538 [Botrytis aclada]